MGVRNGDVLLYRTLQDKAGMLTPNITTLYAFSFWDLAKQGPLVVEDPAGLTAGGVFDIWQQPERPLCGYQAASRYRVSPLSFLILAEKNWI